MMKKNGFTLAEVLITLSIIGVVATMTLPALMTNTQEQQAKTGLKKGINILTEAAQMHEAIEGYNYASLTEKSDVSKLNELVDTENENEAINGIKSLAGMLRERTKVDIGKTLDAASAGGSNIKIGSSDDALFSNPQVIYFNDGTALIFDNSLSQVTGYSVDPFDGLPVGYVAIYDTNGLKGPNELSNCSGKINGGNDTTTTSSKGADGKEVTTTSPTDIKVCEDRSKRVIKDQFVIKLRGNMVQPDGAASTWVFSK